MWFVNKESLKFIILFFAFCLLFSLAQFQYINIFEQRDLIAFWSGVQAFANKINPYDSGQLLQIQHKIFPDLQEAEFFLNPPWSFPLLFPFFSYSFKTVFAYWPLINIFMWAGIAFFLFSISNKKLPPIYMATLPFMFIPFYIVLRFGQLSILVLFFFCAAVFCLVKGKDLYAGIFLFSTSVKPQLFFLFLFCLAIWIVKSKRYKVLIAAIITFLLINSIVFFTYPNIFVLWLNTDFHPTTLQSATITTIIRFFLFKTGFLYDWPIFVIPFIGILVALICLYKKKWVLDLRKDTGPLLALSLIFTPYAWPHDFVVLFPLLLTPMLFYQVDLENKNHRYAVMGTIAFSQLIFFIGPLIIHNLAGYFWYPIVLFFVFICFKQILTKNIN